MAQINNAAIRGEVNFESTAKITGNGNRSNTAYQNTNGTNTFGNTSYDTVVNGKNATVSASTVNIGKSGANIILTGNKTAMNTKFVVNGNVYGTSLPSTGEAGQVFFKII